MIRTLPILALLAAPACLPVGTPAAPGDGDRDRGEHRWPPAVIHTERGVHYQDESGRWHAIGKPHGEGYSGGLFDGEGEAAPTTEQYGQPEPNPPSFDLGEGDPS